VQKVLDESGYDHVSAVVGVFSHLVIVSFMLNKGYLRLQTDFITALLLPLERKLRHSIPQLLKLPPIFAHTIYQALEFDNTLRERYKYCPRGLSEWQGTSGVILNNEGWAQAWREAEKQCALRHYSLVISLLFLSL
jgi:hypothetical protein